MIKIVIVEDEFTIRNGLCQLIPRLSKEFQVIGSAENGYDGMKLIRQYQPDLAICDIRMANYSGLEMIESLRELNINCYFIILSGYSEFAYAQKAIKLGVHDYLLKPVMPEELKKLLMDINQRVNTPQQIYSDKQANSVVLYSPLISRAITSVKDRYSEKISLTTLARESGVTPEYLSSQFTKETGENFSIFLKKVKIDVACKLLLNTNKKIYEIAFSVGYDDPQYFCRVFKSITGVSPKSYLRQKKLVLTDNH